MTPRKKAPPHQPPAPSTAVAEELTIKMIFVDDEHRRRWKERLVGDHQLIVVSGEWCVNHDTGVLVLQKDPGPQWTPDESWWGCTAESLIDLGKEFVSHVMEFVMVRMRGASRN